MYQIPLRFIRISKNVAICATRVVMMADATIPGSYGANLLRAEKREGRLIDATAHEKRRTAIILDNGLVIASARTVSQMMSRIEWSNTKQATAKTRNYPKRMTVYPTEDKADAFDVLDEEPKPEIDTDYKPMSTDEDYDDELDLELDEDDEEEDDEDEDEISSEEDIFEP